MPEQHAAQALSDGRGKARASAHRTEAVEHERLARRACHALEAGGGWQLRQSGALRRCARPLAAVVAVDEQQLSRLHHVRVRAQDDVCAGAHQRARHRHLRYGGVSLEFVAPVDGHHSQAAAGDGHVAQRGGCLAQIHRAGAGCGGGGQAGHRLDGNACGGARGGFVWEVDAKGGGVDAHAKRRTRAARASALETTPEHVERLSAQARCTISVARRTMFSCCHRGACRSGECRRHRAPRQCTVHCGGAARERVAHIALRGPRERCAPFGAHVSAVIVSCCKGAHQRRRGLGTLRAWLARSLPLERAQELDRRRIRHHVRQKRLRLRRRNAAQRSACQVTAKSNAPEAATRDCAAGARAAASQGCQPRRRKTPAQHVCGLT